MIVIVAIVGCLCAFAFGWFLCWVSGLKEIGQYNKDAVDMRNKSLCAGSEIYDLEKEVETLRKRMHRKEKK